MGRGIRRYLYDTDFSGMIDDGWVDIRDNRGKEISPHFHQILIVRQCTWRKTEIEVMCVNVSPKNQYKEYDLVDITHKKPIDISGVLLWRELDFLSGSNK